LLEIGCSRVASSESLSGGRVVVEGSGTAEKECLKRSEEVNEKRRKDEERK